MASLSPLKLNLLVVFGSLWDRFWGGTPLRASIVGTPDKRQARRLDFGGILVDCGVRWGPHFPHVWCFFPAFWGHFFGIRFLEDFLLRVECLRAPKQGFFGTADVSQT